jgi:carbonic anhydrase
MLMAANLVWGATVIAQEHGAAHWSYDGQTGPSHWGDLSADFAPCKAGHHQSPIDIEATQKADLPAIQFDYKPALLHIIDNGHTVMINYAPGSSIKVGDKRYELKQFHFHRPSEEKIKGKRYDMVVHLVHVAQDGSTAVVAVLLQQGGDNALIDELWGDLPNQKNKEELLNTVKIDVSSTRRSRLLHISRISHDTALHGERNLVRTQASRHRVCGRNQGILKALPRRCAAYATQL